MTVERSEAEGDLGLLTVSMGGKPYTLRALSLKESDAWLARVGTLVSTMDMPAGDDGAEMMRSLLVASGRSALGLVIAYDINGTLGGAEAIEGQMSKRELKDALDLMVTVEDPFGEDTARSVAEAFGLPGRLMAAGMAAVEEAVTGPTLRLVSSPSSPSANGDSTTPATSGPSGPASNSSSAGRTRRNASDRKPKSAAS